MVCVGVAKNKTHAYKKNLPPIDKNNVAMANNKIDTSMYSYHPLWPILWYRWSEHKRSFDQKITGCGIALPPGVEVQEYWETRMVSTVNDKYSYTKANLIQALAKQYRGKKYFDIVSYSLWPTSSPRVMTNSV